MIFLEFNPFLGLTPLYLLKIENMFYLFITFFENYLNSNC